MTRNHPLRVLSQKFRGEKSSRGKFLPLSLGNPHQKLARKLDASEFVDLLIAV